MTAVCNDLADYEWLTGDEAAAVLDEMAADPAPLHTALARLRRVFSAVRAGLVVEQVELRRRAGEKFRHADRMFFTRTALEQATDEWVAAYKATRVSEFLESNSGRGDSSRPRFNDTPCADICCGIGGDLLSLAQLSPVVGVDLNPLAVHLAKANAGAVLNREIDIRAVDVAEFDFENVAAWHIDPDRRPDGRRTTSLEWCMPNRDVIEALMLRVPTAAVKLAPATIVPPEWIDRCEREWISRDRQCRQQVAWFGDLAQSSGQHRATIVAAPESWPGSPPIFCRRTVFARPKQPVAIVGKLARYVFDVDPAVTAARLTGALASEHHLCGLGGGTTYLTGDFPIVDDAALACFQVAAVMPFRVRTVLEHLRAKHVGRLEIKKRGVDVDLDRLRKDLKLRGDQEATLLITNVAARPTAIVAARVTKSIDGTGCNFVS